MSKKLLSPLERRADSGTKRYSRSMDSLDVILQTLEDLSVRAQWNKPQPPPQQQPPVSQGNELRRVKSNESEAARDAVVARGVVQWKANDKVGDERKKPANLHLYENVKLERDTQSPVFRYYQSPIDRSVLVQSSPMLAGSNCSLSSSGSNGGVPQHPPPSAPRSTDMYVEMINQEWDAYKSCTSGRLFYHNPTTGETRWKPPRLIRATSLKAGKSVSLPRTPNSIFSFGSAEIEEQEQEDAEDGGGDNTSRVSIVRDSIRRSDESDVVAPPGYTEMYNKSSGLISYHDNVREIDWFTSLDGDGKLYFYTLDGRSEWELPSVPSQLSGGQQQQQAEEEKIPSLDLSWADTGDSAKLNVTLSGPVHRRGGNNRSSSSPSPSSFSKKWVPCFCVLSEGYLLFFTDELSFRRMQQQQQQQLDQRHDDRDTNGLPDVCVDLSQCTLRWFRKRGGRSTSKRRNVIELKSQIGGQEVNLHWGNTAEEQEEQENKPEAIRWFEELRKWVKRVEEEEEKVASATARTLSPSKNLKTDFPSFSAPGTPLLTHSRKFGNVRDRANSGQQQQPQDPKVFTSEAIHISSPTNVIKASPEELRAKLGLVATLSDQNLSLLDDALDGPRSNQHLTAADQIRVFSPKQKRNISRGHNLSQSFRKMAETVHLRPKPANGASSGATRLSRIQSSRSKKLSKFFDPKADDEERRKTKDELIKKGIYKQEDVFGNELNNIKKDPATGLPEFLVRCVQRLELFMDTVGVYRINGDAAIVQKIRLDVDRDDFKLLESTNDASLLASTLKLFCRELPEPLVPASLRELLHQCAWEESPEKLVSKIKAALDRQEGVGVSKKVLGYLMLHLHRVSCRSHLNKMDSKNLATVFAPNLVHSVTRARRPESLISEMEMNNVIVERLIRHAKDIFG